jgi:adenosylmethionine-8-amino-7-oxononanoate aminotransferase
LLRLKSGDGVHVYDDEGKRYLDAASGLWNVALGFNNERLLGRMRCQGGTLAYATLFDGSHPWGELLSAKLIALSAGDYHYSYLSTTGSSAIEVALTVAVMHHAIQGRGRKSRFLAFENGYHGCSYLSRAVSGVMQSEIEAWKLDDERCSFVPSPVDESLSLDAISRILLTSGDDIACFVMEPILGSAGVIVPSIDYCRQLSDLCRQHDVLLVADEVATGCGRAGAFFASKLLELRPDIVALGKGLTAGYFPLSATLFSERVLNPMVRTRTPIPYGSTQDGNPIGCALALEVIDLLMDGDLMRRATEIGTSIRRELRRLGGTSISSVRGRGLMIGIELAHAGDKAARYREPEAIAVRHACLREGLLVYHFESGISLFPPLTFSDQDISEMLSVLSCVLSTPSATRTA